MSKKKGLRVIFRRIKGRLIPLKINHIFKDKKLTVRARKGLRELGELTAEKITGRKKTGRLLGVFVKPKARKKRISEKLFKKAANIFKSMGIEFMRGDVMHPAQVAIRNKFISKFFRRNLKTGKLNRVSVKEAFKITRFKGRVLATTLLKKKKRKK